MTARLRVVVGEDQALVREGIVRVLERAGVDVVGVAVDAPDLGTPPTLVSAALAVGYRTDGHDGDVRAILIAGRTRSPAAGWAERTGGGADHRSANRPRPAGATARASWV